MQRALLEIVPAYISYVVFRQFYRLLNIDKRLLNDEMFGISMP